MNKVYDNGALMLGNIKDVIKKVEEEIKEDIDMCLVDAEELLKDLKDLTDVASIVCVNYDNGMGYSIDYWNENDVVSGKIIK